MYLSDGNSGNIFVSFQKLVPEIGCISSRPSTFAQATKLRRMAAAKERDLAKCYSTQPSSVSKVGIDYVKDKTRSKTQAEEDV